MDEIGFEIGSVQVETKFGLRVWVDPGNVGLSRELDKFGVAGRENVAFENKVVFRVKEL